MRISMAVVALAGLSIASLSAFFGQAEDELKVGSQAPAFSLAGTDGRTHTLAEFNGRRVVVLAWFPKAFTGG